MYIGICAFTIGHRFRRGGSIKFYSYGTLAVLTDCPRAPESGSVGNHCNQAGFFESTIPLLDFPVLTLRSAHIESVLSSIYSPSTKFTVDAETRGSEFLFCRGQCATPGAPPRCYIFLASPRLQW